MMNEKFNNVVEVDFVQPKFEDYGLTEKCVCPNYYSGLSLTGKKYFLEQLAKAKNEATHVVEWVDKNGKEREIYWCLDESEIEEGMEFLSRQLKWTQFLGIKRTEHFEANLAAYHARNILVDEFLKSKGF